MNGVLDVVLAGVALTWAGALIRAIRSKEDPRYRLGVDSPACARGEKVVVIIPARDEVDSIERCVRAALEQELPGLRVVVLDDGSTDGTGEVLAQLSQESPRLAVVQGGDAPLPEGWLGKPWACQRAALESLRSIPETEWMLFLDADVYLEPAAVGVAVHAAVEAEADLLSALGNFELKGFWERVLQPVVAGLILAGNDLATVNSETRSPTKDPLANGQFLLFRRTAWETIGGHQAVAQDVLDDVGLAKTVIASDQKYRLVFMSSLFRVRMYDSLGAIWSGWSKNLFAGLGYSWVRLIFVVGLVLVTSLLPFLVLFLSLWGWGDVRTWVLASAGVGGMFAVRAYLDHSFKQDLRFVPTLPLGSAILILLLVNSAIQTRWGRRTWKGRALQSTGRDP